MAANSQQTVAGPLVYAGQGRDRLCLSPDRRRAALIVYGQGDANCTVQGAVGPGEVLVPDGDETCRIPLSRGESAVQLGSVAPACAYYCGPSASFAGKRFQATPGAPPPTDIAGDPLC